MTLVALALAACPPLDDFESNAFVYNASNEQLLFEISSLPGFDCNELEAFGVENLERNDFVSLGLFKLGAHQVLPLGFPLGNSCACNVFRVSFEGRSVVVRGKTDSIELPQSPNKDQVLEARAHLVFIEPNADPAPGKAIEVIDVPLSAEPEACGDEPPAMNFAVRQQNLNGASIVSVEPVAGQCFEVTAKIESTATSGTSTSGPSAGGAPDLGNAGQGGHAGVSEGTAGGASPDGSAGAGSDPPASGGSPGLPGGGGAAPVASWEERLYLCAPIELFPFGPGDVIDVQLSEVLDPLPFHRLTVTALDGSPRTFQMLLGAHQFGITPETYEVTRVPDGCAARDERRDPWAPLQVTFNRFDVGRRILQQGQTLELTPSGGLTTRIHLGRARAYFAKDACQFEARNWFEVVESQSL